MRGISVKNDSDGPNFLILYLQDRTKLSLFTIGFCTIYFGKHKNLLWNTIYPILYISQ